MLGYYKKKGLSMNKIVEYLLEVSFIAVLIRCLVLGAGIGDAIIGISLVISIVYKNYYLHKSKIDEKEAIYKEIEDHKLATTKEIDDLKGAVTSMKLNTSMKRTINEEKAITPPGRRF